MPPLLVVGAVRRPHGLRGEVVVEVRTDFPERFAEGVALVWRRGALEKTVVIGQVRKGSGGLLIRFAGVEDVDAARALQGGELCVAESEAHPAPPGFFYAHEVRGFSCEDAEGRPLGTVLHLESTPGGPMLTVDAGGGREALVPWTRPIVVDVNRESRRIVLDPPEGLFEL